MSGKIRADLRLKVKPLAKNLIRAQNAGEFIHALGGSENAVRIAQEGFARNIWTQASCYGVNRSGQTVDYAVYTVNQNARDGDAVISIEDDQGRSMIERTDPGFALAVQRMARRFQRKGLRTEIRYRYVDEIERDPARKARLDAELGVSPVPAPPMADGYTFPGFNITPGKDPNQSGAFFFGKRSR